MSSNTPHGLIAELLSAATGVVLLCGCGAEGDDAQRVTNRADDTAFAAEARVHEVRQRFELGVAHPVIGRGVGARFEALGDGSHVQAKIPAEAKRGVRRTARVDLPVNASGQVRLVDDTSGVRIGFALRGARSGSRVATTSDGVVLYTRALDGSDVVHRVTAEGTEDFVVFETRPEREVVAYDVDVSQVAGLRLVSNTLEFLDEGGTPALRVAPPSVVDARGGVHDATLAVDGCRFDTDPRGPWGRAVVRPGAQSCSVQVRWSGVAYPAILDPTWVATGSMLAGRRDHTATLLASGKVLVAGGVYQSSAELYDPSGSGSFAATGSMATGRELHTATLLGSGKVLIVGGETNFGIPVSSAELYDPSGSGSFAPTGSLAAQRSAHTATLLGSGKVLVAGGFGKAGILSSAELYDPSGSGSFETTGAMGAARSYHTATLLGSGKVLMVGGFSGSAHLSSAELYDPSGSGSFGATASMAWPRVQHSATLLGSGKVLIAAGGSGSASWSAELYDPSGSGSFAATGSLTSVRKSHTATLLGSGNVLLAGGFATDYLSSAELYDPSGSGSFTATSSLATVRYGHRATLLGSGAVLVTGGYIVGKGFLSSAELFELTAAGSDCTLGSECATGYCSDGVCCDTPCSGCNACTAAKKGGGTDGVCGPVLAETDPNNGCEADLPTSCQQTGLCDGAGGCALYPKGTACGSSNGCSNGTVQVSACDGSGACAAQQTSCAPYANCADANSCASTCASSSDCIAAAYCNGAVCKPRSAQGAACINGEQCRTGWCVDGFCCDAACTGQCEACDVSGSVGTCAPVSGPPHGSRPKCLSSDPSGSCSTLSCNGIDRSQCQCTASAPSAQCDGEHTVTAPDGVSKTDCMPFRCDGSGTCKTSCTSVNDCVAGYLCDEAAHCVRAPSTIATEDSGCGCRQAGSDRRALPLPAGLLLIAAALSACFRKRMRTS